MRDPPFHPPMGNPLQICITISHTKNLHGTENRYDNRYTGVYRYYSVKISGTGRHIVITGVIVVPRIVITGFYCIRQWFTRYIIYKRKESNCGYGLWFSGYLPFVLIYISSSHSLCVVLCVSLCVVRRIALVRFGCECVDNHLSTRLTPFHFIGGSISSTIDVIRQWFARYINIKEIKGHCYRHCAHY
jgi:hypothetical protein